MATKMPVMPHNAPESVTSLIDSDNPVEYLSVISVSIAARGLKQEAESNGNSKMDTFPVRAATRCGRPRRENRNKETIL